MSRKLLLAVSAFVCMTWICTAETSFLSENDKMDDIQRRIEQEKERQKGDTEKENKNYELTPEARQSCCGGMTLEQYCNSPKCRQDFCSCLGGAISGCSGCRFGSVKYSGPPSISCR